MASIIVNCNKEKVYKTNIASIIVNCRKKVYKTSMASITRSFKDNKYIKLIWFPLLKNVHAWEEDLPTFL